MTTGYIFLVKFDLGASVRRSGSDFSAAVRHKTRKRKSKKLILIAVVTSPHHVQQFINQFSVFKRF